MLEFVATIPSSPLGGWVVDTLDIASRFDCNLFVARLRGAPTAKTSATLGYTRNFANFPTAGRSLQAITGGRLETGVSAWPTRQAGQMLKAVLLRICSCISFVSGRARNSSRFFLISGTPGPGQSVPNKVLCAISSSRGKYFNSVLGGIPLISR